MSKLALFGGSKAVNSEPDDMLMTDSQSGNGERHQLKAIAKQQNMEQEK